VAQACLLLTAVVLSTEYGVVAFVAWDGMGWFLSGGNGRVVEMRREEDTLVSW
jgi:hypothetical protein